MSGAIDSFGNYVLPDDAEKGQDYTCPDLHCRRKVYLKKGEIKRPHFCHYADSDCTYYERVGESAEHKNGKIIIRNILEQKRDFSIIQTCGFCKNKLTYIVPKNVTDIREEYPIGNYRRADVGCKLMDDSLLLFEVYHTSITLETNRQGAWFEFTTHHIFDQYHPTGHLVFYCNRKIECETCKQKKQELEEKRLARIKEERRLQFIEMMKKNDICAFTTERLRNIELQKQYEIKMIEDRKKFNEEFQCQQLEYEMWVKEEIIRKKMEEEQKELYNEVHKQYLKEVVEPYVFDPTIRINSIMYKGFDFLHPNEIHRLRIKNDPKEKRKYRSEDLEWCYTK